MVGFFTFTQTRTGRTGMMGVFVLGNNDVEFFLRETPLSSRGARAC